MKVTRLTVERVEILVDNDDFQQALQYLARENFVKVNSANVLNRVYKPVEGKAVVVGEKVVERREVTAHVRKATS